LGQIGGKPPLIFRGLRRFSNIAGISPLIVQPTLKSKMGSLWKMVIAKLLIIPLLLVPFVAFSIPFPLGVITVLVSGMPSAQPNSLYAQKYGADFIFASMGVLVTTFLCMFTIPFLYLIR
jgi:malate permease and related proteins